MKCSGERDLLIKEPVLASKKLGGHVRNPSDTRLAIAVGIFIVSEAVADAEAVARCRSNAGGGLMIAC